MTGPGRFGVIGLTRNFRIGHNTLGTLILTTQQCRSRIQKTEMAFSICFKNEPNQYLDDDPTVPSAIGRIVADQLDEEFVSSLYEWNKETYQAQWLHSLKGFLGGDKKAVLITWYVNPKESSNLQWWALYRGDGDTVHIQNHLPWYCNFDRDFSAAEASSFLHDRTTSDEDGNALSEWNVSVVEIKNFFEQLKQQSAVSS